MSPSWTHTHRRFGEHNIYNAMYYYYYYYIIIIIVIIYLFIIYIIIREFMDVVFEDVVFDNHSCVTRSYIVFECNIYVKSIIIKHHIPELPNYYYHYYY